MPSTPALEAGPSANPLKRRTIIDRSKFTRQAPSRSVLSRWAFLGVYKVARQNYRHGLINIAAYDERYSQFLAQSNRRGTKFVLSQWYKIVGLASVPSRRAVSVIRQKMINLLEGGNMVLTNVDSEPVLWNELTGNVRVPSRGVCFVQGLPQFHLKTYGSPSMFFVHLFACLAYASAASSEVVRRLVLASVLQGIDIQRGDVQTKVRTQLLPVLYRECNRYSGGHERS